MSSINTEFMQQVFDVDMRAEEIFGIDKVCEADFICSVQMSNGDDTALVRFGFEYNLMTRLVSKILDKQSANDKAVLQDAGSEVANIVSGRVKEFLNSQGHNLKSSIPDTTEGPVENHDDASNVDIVFYDAEDHLAVDVNLGSMASSA